MLILLVAATLLPCTAAAQDNTGSIHQSTQSHSSSSSIATASSLDTSTISGPPQNQGSAEMNDWIKSNSSSTASRSSSDFGIGFGRDNHQDEDEDDQPRWSRHKPSYLGPEQIDGTYRVSAQNGPFLCTVRLNGSAYFGGDFATTSPGCPEPWKVTCWALEGPSVVLINSSGDVYATFWPRDRDVWVGRGYASGQRLSISR